MGRLVGKVAFITGGGGGIGQATAVRFAEEGAKVVVAEINRELGEAAVAAACSRAQHGGDAAFVSCDVTDKQSVTVAFRDAVQRFGRLDILHNNAGGATPHDGRVTEAPEEEFWRAIKLDLFGTFLCSKVAIPEIAKCGGGSIINMSSVVAIMAMPGRDCYTAAKGGISALTRSMAVEYAADRIRVNAVAPSVTLSDRVKKQLEGNPVTEELGRQHLLGLIEPIYIADMVVYLASDESGADDRPDLPCRQRRDNPLIRDREVGPTPGVFDTMQDPIDRTEACTIATVRRAAAMLDLDPEHLRDGDPLPRGWHFVVLGGETRRSALRADGFPGFGVPMPVLGLPRLLLAGRSVKYIGDLVIGAPVLRRSWISKFDRKETSNGPMAIVTIRHELSSAGAAPPAIFEDQTYILLGSSTERATPVRPAEPVLGAHRKVLVPDETLLFQYSALGFNSHKIHIDRDYARNVEGLPDLVVNGGLTTLLLTEFMRLDVGVRPARLSAKHKSPLYCGRPMTLTATQDGDVWRLKIHDDTGVVAVDAEMHAQ